MPGQQSCISPPSPSRAAQSLVPRVRLKQSFRTGSSLVVRVFGFRLSLSRVPVSEPPSFPRSLVRKRGRRRTLKTAKNMVAPRSFFPLDKPAPIRPYSGEIYHITSSFSLVSLSLALQKPSLFVPDYGRGQRYHSAPLPSSYPSLLFSLLPSSLRLVPVLEQTKQGDSWTVAFYYDYYSTCDRHNTSRTKGREGPAVVQELRHGGTNTWQHAARFVTTARPRSSALSMRLFSLLSP